MDSRAGTLIREMSHFEVVARTCYKQNGPQPRAVFYSVAISAVAGNQAAEMVLLERGTRIQSNA